MSESHEIRNVVLNHVTILIEIQIMCFMRRILRPKKLLDSKRLAKTEQHEEESRVDGRENYFVFTFSFVDGRANDLVVHFTKRTI
jgi:hypothetical protein